MDTETLKQQLTDASRALFVDAQATPDSARDIGQAVGGQVFAGDDPQVLVRGLYNMEAYFHVLRSSALAALKQLLANRYTALVAVIADASGTGVQLRDGSRRALPVHTSPDLPAFVAALEPVRDEDDPRVSLTLLQQTVRLLEVLGMPRLTLRSGAAADIVHRQTS